MIDDDTRYLTRTLPLVSVNDPILSQKCDPFVFQQDKSDAWQLSLDLINTMKDKNGIGLAANQVGVNARVFCASGLPPMVFFNPRIVDVSSETILLEEGCLSTPGLYVKVKRPIHIKLRYQDADGEFHTEKMTGMTARIVQHEIDHLDGIMFYQRASRFHREQAQRQVATLYRKMKK